MTEKEKIRIIVVDDVEQTRTDIKRLLYFEEDMEVVGEAENGQKAIEIVAKESPDVILMDINMPVMDGIEATENISLANPDLAVIIISIQGEQEYLKKAMVAGARDYLVKPLGSEEMSSTIRQCYKLNKERKAKISPQKEVSSSEPSSLSKHRIISLFSGKGGVGKTFLGVNLAVSLAKKKIKTALVDLDLQFGDVSVHFNLNNSDSIADLCQEEEINKETIDRYLIQHTSGVHILPAPLWPQEAEKITPDNIEKILAVLTKSYDCVVIDTPALFSDSTLYALDYSDLIIIPVKKDIAAIKNTKASLDILYSLEYGKKVQILLNEAELGMGIETSDLEKSLGMKVVHNINKDDKNVVNSINRGIPLVMQQNNTDIGRALIDLSCKVINGFEVKNTVKKNKALITRMLSL